MWHPGKAGGGRTSTRWFKFIGCEIIYREACFLAATVPHRVDVEFLLKGLHDLQRQDMIDTIQAAVDRASAEGRYEAILLGYARCNDGLVGIQARGVPLVIPKAHDCITFFFGSRAAYNEYFNEHPGTYFLTTGWSERNIDENGNYAQPAYGKDGVMAKLGLTEPYEDMVEKYGKEHADFIIESLGGWESSYSRGLFLKMGVCNEAPFIEDAKKRAQEKGWDFEERQGDMTLLEKLFMGEWNDDFVVVQPGQRIAARNDAEVLAAED